MDKEPLTIQPTNEADDISSERLSLDDMPDQIGKHALGLLDIQAVYDVEKTPEEAEAATSMANLRDFFRINEKIKDTIFDSSLIYVDNPEYTNVTDCKRNLFKALKTLDCLFDDLAEKFGQLVGNPEQIIKKRVH